MSCAYVFVFVLVLTASVLCTVGALRRPRQLYKAGEHKLFIWRQSQMLFMYDNGTVQLKPAKDRNCRDCEVDLQFLCQKHNVTGCPKRRHKQRDNDTLTPTILMMQFVSAGKYLCMNRNATFYAVANPSDGQLEECAFYVVNNPKNGRVLIYHFKYPEKKRNCRLSERRKNARKLCVKYYLQKGNDSSLTVYKGKFFNKSHWTNWTHSKRDLAEPDV